VDQYRCRYEELLGSLENFLFCLHPLPWCGPMQQPVEWSKSGGKIRQELGIIRE